MGCTAAAQQHQSIAASCAQPRHGAYGQGWGQVAVRYDRNSTLARMVPEPIVPPAPRPKRSTKSASNLQQQQQQANTIKHTARVSRSSRGYLRAAARPNCLAKAYLAIDITWVISGSMTNRTKRKSSAIEQPPASLPCHCCRPSVDRTADTARSSTSMDHSAPSARRMGRNQVCCT